MLIPTRLQQLSQDEMDMYGSIERVAELDSRTSRRNSKSLSRQRRRRDKFLADNWIRFEKAHPVMSQMEKK